MSLAFFPIRNALYVRQPVEYLALIETNSLWRPISGPIEDHPIAVCDGRALDLCKLIETDMIRGDYTGTLLYPQYEPNDTYQWYYMSGQDVEDVLLFKSFDTKKDSVKCKWSTVRIISFILLPYALPRLRIGEPILSTLA
jgi:hypothetical protein